MSGYLEVKYPFKSNLGLNPFKSWKRQWCILRPSSTSAGGSLAVYCSEAGAAAGAVALPAGAAVRRTKSRSRPHAFAVFPAEERKPCVLLAAQTLQDAQTWMEKIRALLKGENLFDTGPLKDSFSVTIVPTDLSRKCGLNADGTASVAPSGILITRAQKLGALVEWRHVAAARVEEEVGRNGVCVVSVDSEYRLGGGELQLSTPLAGALCAALRTGPRRARSHEDLAPKKDDPEDTSRSSWSSEPSEVSLDDLELLTKGGRGGQRARCAGAGHKAVAANIATCNDSTTDRRSMLSVASGIYEEIKDPPEPPDGVYCPMGAGAGAGAGDGALPLPAPLAEPTYESVAECAYAAMRRGRRQPPPLPPRAPFGTMKLGASWNSRMNQPAEVSGVTRHGSLGSLPRCCSVGSAASTRSDNTHAKKQGFSVFRKRVKSDSRVAISPKSDTSKENKDANVEMKKKKFDFQPPRDLFKSFKVGRKMRGLKITTLAKTETKSCEFLDETEHVTTQRCSKSVECLEDEFFDEFDGDLSIELNDDAVAALALPKEIVDIILRGREQSDRMRLTAGEGDYLPMSPAPAQATEHYAVMSPKSKVA